MMKRLGDHLGEAWLALLCAVCGATGHWICGTTVGSNLIAWSFNRVAWTLIEAKRARRFPGE
ncbi:MAG: hypothetical protein NVSMB19_26610 [Vulcanimicrobiaceae bacterium]